MSLWWPGWVSCCLVLAVQQLVVLLVHSMLRCAAGHTNMLDSLPLSGGCVTVYVCTPNLLNPACDLAAEPRCDAQRSQTAALNKVRF